MSKVIIINELENGREVIKTNVPMCAIKDFLEEYCAANVPEDSEDEEEEESNIVSYIKEKYPKFYEVGKENEMFDESFVGAIGIMARDMELSKEEVIDHLLCVIHANGVMGMLGVHLASEALAIAKMRWKMENGIED